MSAHGWVGLNPEVCLWADWPRAGASLLADGAESLHDWLCKLGVPSTTAKLLVGR